MKRAAQSDQNVNPLCQRCLRSCKQPSCHLLVSCPRYQPLPFKIESHQFIQLDLFPSRRKT